VVCLLSDIGYLISILPHLGIRVKTHPAESTAAAESTEYGLKTAVLPPPLVLAYGSRRELLAGPAPDRVGVARPQQRTNRRSALCRFFPPGLYRKGQQVVVRALDAQPTQHRVPMGPSVEQMLDRVGVGDIGSRRQFDRKGRLVRRPS